MGSSNCKYVYDVEFGKNNLKIKYITNGTRDHIYTSYYDNLLEDLSPGTIIKVSKNNINIVPRENLFIISNLYGVLEANFIFNMIIIDYKNDDKKLFVPKKYDIEKFKNKKCKIWYSSICFDSYHIRYVTYIEEISNIKHVDKYHINNKKLKHKNSFETCQFLSVKNVSEGKLCISISSKDGKLVDLIIKNNDQNFVNYCRLLAENNRFNIYYKKKTDSFYTTYYSFENTYNIIEHIIPCNNDNIFVDYGEIKKVIPFVKNSEYDLLFMKNNLVYIVQKSNKLKAKDIIKFEFIVSVELPPKIIKIEICTV